MRRIAPGGMALTCVTRALLAGTVPCLLSQQVGQADGEKLTGGTYGIAPTGSYGTPGIGWSFT